MTRVFAVGATCAIALLIGGTLVFALLNEGAPDPECGESQVVSGKAGIGGPFNLIDGSGTAVSDADVITEPSLVYFGYTFCPDVCPLDNARNAAATELLAESGTSVTPVFVTVDPDRDTPAVVDEFAKVFHENMIGLTGTQDQISEAAKAFRVYYRKQPGDDEYYLVDHTTFTYLMFPRLGIWRIVQARRHAGGCCRPSGMFGERP